MSQQLNRAGMQSRSSDYASVIQTALAATLQFVCFAIVLKPGISDRPLNESFEKYHRLTLSILRTFGADDRGVMETRIGREVEDLVAELKKRHSAPLYPLSIVNASVVNVIFSLLFGRRLDRSHPVLDELVTQVHCFGRGRITVFPVHLFPFLRFLPPVRRLVGDIVAAHDWLLSFLGRQMDEVLTNGDEEASFVRSFVEAEGADGYDRDELLHLLRDMTVAGLEASSTTVMWMIVVLAEHREVQMRLQEQIDAVIGGDGVGYGGCSGVGGIGEGSGRLPSLADRPRLAYVEATLLELMRFKSVMPVGAPRETVRDAVVDGCVIPAGTMVVN
jgi:cytochrome P450